MNQDDSSTDHDRSSTTDHLTSRRRFLLASGAVGMAGLAGCTTVDVLRGEEVEFEAGTATVADAVLADTGYQLRGVSAETRTREFEVAGRPRAVQVTNRTAEYDKAVELLGERYQAAVFTALATPRVELLGRSYNPIADSDSEDLAERITARYDDVSDLERGTDYTTSILRTDTTVVVYAAQGDIEGTDLTIDLELQIADPVEAGDDFVVCLAAYPESFGDGENVRRMMNGVEHTPE